MKRQDLEKIEGLTKEQIDSIMNLHQTDVTSWQTKITGLQNDKNTLETQLNQYKDVNVDDLQTKITNLEKEKQTLETEKADLVTKHTDEINGMKLNGALDKAIYGTHTVDSIALKAHLNMKEIKLDENGALTGFDEQLETIKKDHGYLFKNQTTGGAHGVIKETTGTLSLGEALHENYDN